MIELHFEPEEFLPRVGAWYVESNRLLRLALQAAQSLDDRPADNVVLLVAALALDHQNNLVAVCQRPGRALADVVPVADWARAAASSRGDPGYVRMPGRDATFGAIVDLHRRRPAAPEGTIVVAPSQMDDEE